MANQTGSNTNGRDWAIIDASMPVQHGPDGRPEPQIIACSPLAQHALGASERLMATGVYDRLLVAPVRGAGPGRGCTYELRRDRFVALGTNGWINLGYKAQGY
jgi:hypothetical protein